MRPWLLLLVPAPAWAATLAVPGAYPTIQSAVNAANNGDRIEVQPGVYAEEVTIDVDVVVVGVGGSAVVTVDAGRPFDIADATVVLSGFTLLADERGVDVENGRLDALDLVITGVDNDNDGGGIRFRDASGGLTQVVFADNDVRGSDGAHLFLENSDVSVTDASFTGGHAHDGGALWIDGGSSLTLTDAAIDGNVATNRGGGFRAFNGADLVFDSVSLIANAAENGGGGGYCEADTLTLDATLFTANTVDAGEQGAALWLIGTAATSTGTIVSDHLGAYGSGAVLLESSARWDGVGDLATNNQIVGANGGAFSFRSLSDGSFALSTFEANHAERGGAIDQSADDLLTLDACLFTDNVATSGDGGAVRFSGTTFTSSGTRFLDNTAAGLGGALWSDGPTVVVTDSALLHNEAGSGGGGAFLTGATATWSANAVACNAALAGDGGGVLAAATSGTWTNNVFAENNAFDQGGGVYWSFGSAPNLRNDTFLGNAAFLGGGAYVDGVGFNWENNVVASHPAGGGLGAGAGILGVPFGIQYSLWDQNLATDLTGGLLGYVLNNTQVYGSPDLMWSADADCTNDTWKPNVGSRVIDAGNPLLLDPDGSPSDIGAFGGPSADLALWTDGDGDGFIALHDCDDTDATVFPGGAEVCDAADSDCDADFNDPGQPGNLTFYADTDGDGYGDPLVTWIGCIPPDGWVIDATDCNDTAAAYPGATEVCDGLDNDCDGLVDAGAIDATTWYLDSDGDGYGDSLVAVDACAQPAGYVATPGDCNDGAASSHPGALEVCDNVDNDCDANTDEDAIDATAWFQDVDGDGVGNAGVVAVACDPPPDFTGSAGDCDDRNAAVNPSATEVCNGIDDDCNGLADGVDAVDATTWHRDGDQDGWGDPSIDAVSCVAPAGFVAPTGDCDDGNSAVYPYAPETCGDLTDANCDGQVGYGDADADGVPACEDCDDTDPAVLPGAVETCNGKDDDCDGLVDEADAADATLWYADTDHDGYGDLTSNVVACDAPAGYVADGTDCDDSSALFHPDAAESCAVLLDTNCDGAVGDADTDADGSIACEDCDDTDPQRAPGATEACDAVDNDCDGLVDEDGATEGATWYLDDDGDGFGDPATALRACVAPAGSVADGTDCDDSDAARYPGATDLPDDGIDQDCDGSDATAPPPGDTGADTDLPEGGVPVVAEGGCGCDTRPGVAAGAPGALLALLLATRRRMGGARQA